MVPRIAFNLIQELEGKDKLLLNKGLEGYWIETALQTIEFRLERTGATLESHAVIPAAAIPGEYAFDGPFLIHMKKRGTSQPFFAMWVDNAKLLSRF